jgi:FKBP-type peptidyl-prolyl cis-trans isomerase
VISRFALIGFLALTFSACSKPFDLKDPPPDALKTPSGIYSKVLQVGLGSVHPGPTSTVVVNYTGWMTNGEVFDSSQLHGGPATFPLDGVIPGWTEGVQLMRVGEKRRFWIPGKLAYGDNNPPGQPNGTLVFDIELLDIK